MTFPEALKRLRNEQHMTQKDMALVLGIHESAYRRYELGHSSPSIAFVTRIADLFKVSLDYVVGRSDVPNSEKVAEPIVVSAEILEQIRQKAYDSVDKEIKRLFPSFHIPARQ